MIQYQDVSYIMGEGLGSRGTAAAKLCGGKRGEGGDNQHFCTINYIKPSLWID